MRNLEDIQSEKFKGAGILTGLTIGLSAAIIIFIITGNIAFIGPVTGAFGIPLGLSFENKFQRRTGDDNHGDSKIWVVLIAIGVLCLAASYILAKFL